MRISTSQAVIGGGVFILACVATLAALSSFSPTSSSSSNSNDVAAAVETLAPNYEPETVDPEEERLQLLDPDSVVVVTSVLANSPTQQLFHAETWPAAKAWCSDRKYRCVVAPPPQFDDHHHHQVMASPTTRQMCHAVHHALTVWPHDLGQPRFVLWLAPNTKLARRNITMESFLEMTPSPIQLERVFTGPDFYDGNALLVRSATFARHSDFFEKCMGGKNDNSRHNNDNFKRWADCGRNEDALADCLGEYGLRLRVNNLMSGAVFASGKAAEELDARLSEHLFVGGKQLIATFPDCKLLDAASSQEVSSACVKAMVNVNVEAPGGVTRRLFD